MSSFSGSAPRSLTRRRRSARPTPRRGFSARCASRGAQALRQQLGEVDDVGGLRGRRPPRAARLCLDLPAAILRLTSWRMALAEMLACRRRASRARSCPAISCAAILRSAGFRSAAAARLPGRSRPVGGAHFLRPAQGIQHEHLVGDQERRQVFFGVHHQSGNRDHVGRAHGLAQAARRPSRPCRSVAGSKAVRESSASTSDALTKASISIVWVLRGKAARTSSSLMTT